MSCGESRGRSSSLGLKSNTKRIATIISLLWLILPASVFALEPRCACVLWLRTQFGVQIYGDANRQVPNIPFNHMDKGDVLLMRFGNIAHAALIVGFEEEVEWRGMISPRYIWITDTNAVKKCTPSTRRIQIDDERITGVYRPK